MKGSRYFCERLLRHPCRSISKNHATAYALGCPSRPGHSLATQQGVAHMLPNDSTRFRIACIFTSASLRENSGTIASGDYSTPVSQRLNPTEIMTDTAGASDLVFGLFWLLGYQFSPHLADAGEAVFWRIDKNADYGVLNDLARGSVNTRRIEQHWDDMLKIAGSLKLGTIQASELIRSLLKSDRPSSLAKAIIDAGRINKTLYLLNYIDDEDYRRRILTQLNRGEGRHAVARVICHGQRGEIRKRYREGQEDQLGALGLVTNAVVLWNTLYMQAALDHLWQRQQEIREEDEKRLSPLLHGHVNVLGHYSFTLAEQVMMGQLRPLNQPSENIITLP
ncbi:Tn3 family transposase [Methylovulum psychrotolerans]|uniref:Tn3 family transposase n=1 Tax=Methylovulum psychrotolerans TaxID=1704499 RepID=A0A2S5CFQ9_9GAMM|nr:Tn3 family transposase [Methylovulum psychrotolerans]